MPDDQQPNLWRMAHMGLEFAGAALLVAGLGFYIDYQFGTLPWGTVTGLVLGVIGGMYRFLREAMLANQPEKGRKKGGGRD
jgi:F0F1-type ATP synthase assembly protein I